MPQRRGDVERRKHFRPGRLDVGFETFDVAVRFGVLLVDSRELAGSVVLILPGAGGRHAPRDHQ
jgi:hypothetical protein